MVCSADLAACGAGGYDWGMASERDKARRWCQLRLWQLFALVAFVAVILWASKHLSFAIVYTNQETDEILHSGVIVGWDDWTLIDWEEGEGPTQPFFLHEDGELSHSVPATNNHPPQQE